MAAETTQARGPEAVAGRALGCFETALQLTGEPTPFNLVIVLRLGGGPTPEQLQSAFIELQNRHPLLRVRIVKQGERYQFEPEGVPAIPLRLVDRANDEDWRTVAEDELNRRLDVAVGPALRVTCLLPPADDGNREFVLTFNHAVTDADSAMTLLQELLDLCDPGSLPLEPPATGLAPAAEELFPARFRGSAGGARLLGFAARQIADEVLYRLRSHRSQRPPVGNGARCRLLPLQLNEEATASLIRSTRRMRLTLNGTCGAAMLLAVHRNLYGSGAVPLRYFTFADLRPQLHPPVAAASSWYS